MQTFVCLIFLVCLPQVNILTTSISQITVICDNLILIFQLPRMQQQMFPLLPVHPAKHWVGANNQKKKIVVGKSFALLHNHQQVSECNLTINGRIARATWRNVPLVPSILLYVGESVAPPASFFIVEFISYCNLHYFCQENFR